MNTEMNSMGISPLGQNTPETAANLAIRAKIAEDYSKIVYKHLLKVVRKPVDLKREETIGQGFLHTNRPVYTYSIETIAITASDLQVLPNGKQMIRFNTDNNLMFPITGIQEIKEVLPVPDPTSVTAAIVRFETEKKVTYFTDHAALNSVVNAMNAQSKAEIELLAANLMDSVKTLNGIDAVNNQVFTSCMAQFGVIV